MNGKLGSYGGSLELFSHKSAMLSELRKRGLYPMRSRMIETVDGRGVGFWTKVGTIYGAAVIPESTANSWPIPEKGDLGNDNQSIS